MSINRFLVTQPISATSLPLPSGASTEVSQTVLETLVETLQELCQRLAPLAGAMNSGLPALRSMLLTGSTTAVTTVTTVTTVSTVTGITNIGAVPAYTIAVAQHNLTAVLSNINNVVGG